MIIMMIMILMMIMIITMILMMMIINSWIVGGLVERQHYSVTLPQKPCHAFPCFRSALNVIIVVIIIVIFITNVITIVILIMYFHISIIICPRCRITW